MICRVCARQLEPWAIKESVPLLRCSDCGSIHAECSKPTEDLYADLYSKDETVPPVVAASLDAVVDSMRPFRTRGRWLDIGFGQGALLEAAARGGWLCHGTELSGVAREKGATRGFITTTGTEALNDGEFDIVSLVELLEHVETPARFLLEARRVLRRGGCLYLTTPNGWSLNRWVLGAPWSVFAPPDHITIFTPPALRRLLAEAGFDRISLRTEGLNPYEMLTRQKTGCRPVGLNRAETSTRLCETLSGSPGRRGLKRAANAVLSGLRIGDSLKARAQ